MRQSRHAPSHVAMQHHKLGVQVLVSNIAVAHIPAMRPLIVHHPAYTAVDHVPSRHFPTKKFGRLVEVLQEDGVANRAEMALPTPADVATLSRAHDADYVNAVVSGELSSKLSRRIGAPITPAIVQRSVAAAGGTLLAARLALAHGVACNTAGGGHHADRQGGAGFCIFNDVAVAIFALLDDSKISNALVLDLDVHQGDGTARIFEDTPCVRTISVHCQDNWPHRKAQSDVDVGLPVNTGDDQYLNVLSDVLSRELRQSWDIVFYNAGVDPHRNDALGRLKLSNEGIFARDHMVIRTCLDLHTPIVAVMGGGYDPDLTALARRHALLHRAVKSTITAGADVMR